MIYVLIILIGVCVGFILNHIFYFQKRIRLMRATQTENNDKIDYDSLEEKQFTIQFMFVKGLKSVKSLNVSVNNKIIFSKISKDVYNYDTHEYINAFYTIGTEKEVCNLMLNTARQVMDSNSHLPIKILDKILNPQSHIKPSDNPT